MKEWLMEWTKSTFTSLDTEIQEIIKILTQDPSTTGGLWEIVTNVFAVILPIGFTLATLFFFIDFLNKAIMMDFVKMENVVKPLFKLVVCKLVMENSLQLLTGIMKAFLAITNSIGGIGNGSMSSLINLQPIQEHIEQLDFWGVLGYTLELLPVGLLMIIAKYIIMAVAYARLLQLCLYTALAPIPLSTMAGETTHDIAKSFIGKYAAVCLQGALILVCCALYYGLLSFIFEGQAGIFPLVVSTIVLAFMIIKSGSFAKDLCNR